MRGKRWICTFILFLLCVSSTALADNETQPEWLVEQYGEPVLMSENADIYEAGITICFFPGEGIVILYKESENSGHLKAWEVLYADALDDYVAEAIKNEPIKTVYIDFSDMSAKQYPDSFTATAVHAAERYSDYKAFLQAVSNNIIAANSANITTIEVPMLTEISKGVQVRLKEYPSEKKESRRQAYAGPGKTYATAGAYKPYKQRDCVAYFAEDEWVLVLLKYQTVNDRFLYFKNSSFEQTTEVPQKTEMLYFPGVVNITTFPSWGPGDEYEIERKYEVEAATEVKVFFQENGYYYAEFNSQSNCVRMWLKKEQVTMTGSQQACDD